MTLSVIVCLIPNEIYYTILIFTDTDFSGFFAIADILEWLTIVTDPMLGVLGNTELRNMALDFIRRFHK
ncbi:hypothetical protein RvY_14079 [Ramazzottius varieornatus]|uniref:G-protein coupled receptors family 1 profile domain-containing protein n=1 Tax=Ramazzottius varieornatus TaxID=947166 RepID=A0A1D1VYL2_RAMVA|nr:hypothetical protein RvY_14079 [Ramazzottius varieornatus]